MGRIKSIEQIKWMNKTSSDIILVLTGSILFYFYYKISIHTYRYIPRPELDWLETHLKFRNSSGTIPMLLFHFPQGRTRFLLYGLPITNIPLNSPSRKFDHFNYRVVSRNTVEYLRFTRVWNRGKKSNKKERRGRRKYTRIHRDHRGAAGGRPSTNTRARVFHSVDTPQSAL